MIDFSQLTQLSFSEATVVLKDFVIFVAAVVVYAVVIFKFYRFLATKNLFKLDLDQYNEAAAPGLHKFISIIFYILEYVLILPIFIFFWFVFLSLLLITMSKQPLETVLLIAMALVAVIRATAYYNEELSKDLAKIIPFALLGIFLIDISYFSLADSWETLKQIPSALKTIAYYFIFTVGLELFLRILQGMISPFRSSDDEEG